MTKNMDIMKITVWKIFLLGGLLAFSLLFWLNDHVGYSATSVLLINGHDGNQDEVLAQTVAAFSRTETFVERTLGSTRLQESSVGMELSPEEQAQVVKGAEVRGGGKKGGLVFVTIHNGDAEVAEILSTESTETLLRMSRMYLGDEAEFSVTAIETAVVEKSIIQVKAYILKSFATTLGLFLLVLFFQPVLFFVFQKIRRVIQALLSSHKKESGYQEETPEALDQRFVPQKLDPAFLYSVPETVPDTQLPLPKASEVLNNEVYGKTPLQSVSVSVEDLPFTFETPKEEVAETQQITKETLSSEEAPVLEKEPTMLEYKRRLNELLAQK